MLLRKHCPYTDVVNFFEASEPHIAIGSISKCGTACDSSSARRGYAWRFHDAENTRSGIAPDPWSAEQHLRDLVFDAVVARSASRR